LASLDSDYQALTRSLRRNYAEKEAFGTRLTTLAQGLPAQLRRKICAVKLKNRLSAAEKRSSEHEKALFWPHPRLTRNRESTSAHVAHSLNSEQRQQEVMQVR